MSVRIDAKKAKKNHRGFLEEVLSESILKNEDLWKEKGVSRPRE